MRHTASLQVNLDLGPEGLWQERWLLANLMAPITLAVFANSPGPAGVSTRALSWQHLDPTRTGFPAALVAAETSDPKSAWAEAAMDAEVMLVRSEDGRWMTPEPGFSFRDWVTHGHPEVGWPTLDDLEYHLTTLFFEVRPKGFLELRTCDSLPDRWRAAPVVFTTALLYDDRARTQALDLLGDGAAQLPEAWTRAARLGIRDEELGRRALRLWDIALAGAARLGSRFFGDGALPTAREFLAAFTDRGRMPADVLSNLAGDPPASLSWATDCGLCDGGGKAPQSPENRVLRSPAAACACQAS
jgi:glutamate--cysteine ligase